jgi:hypothetical protein
MDDPDLASDDNLYIPTSNQGEEHKAPVVVAKKKSTRAKAAEEKVPTTTSQSLFNKSSTFFAEKHGQRTPVHIPTLHLPTFEMEPVRLNPHPEEAKNNTILSNIKTLNETSSVTESKVSESKMTESTTTTATAEIKPTSNATVVLSSTDSMTSTSVSVSAPSETNQQAAAPNKTPRSSNLLLSRLVSKDEDNKPEIVQISGRSKSKTNRTFHNLTRESSGGNNPTNSNTAPSLSINTTNLHHPPLSPSRVPLLRGDSPNTPSPLNNELRDALPSPQLSSNNPPSTASANKATTPLLNVSFSPLAVPITPTPQPDSPLLPNQLGQSEILDTETGPTKSAKKVLHFESESKTSS